MFKLRALAFIAIMMYCLSANAFDWKIDTKIIPDRNDYDKSDGIISNIATNGFPKNYKLSLDQSTYFNQMMDQVSERLPKVFNKLPKVTFQFVTMAGSYKKTMGTYYQQGDIIRINYELIRLQDEKSQKNLVHTLIHELTHIYDLKVKNLSKNNEYMYLAGFQKKGVLLHTLNQRNFATHSSPDIYEFTNLQESLAVNMEYFTLDPQYKCRRPSLYKYLSKNLEHIPFENQSCDEHFYLPVFTDNGVIHFNYNDLKLYQIHYLFADKGEELTSRWGHSMLRLVFCAPARKEAGPECLNDLEYQVVLSYRGSIPEDDANILEKLLMHSPMKMFIYPMVSIIKEYNEGEFRNLISSPLKLNQGQLKKVKDQILEEAWAYSGKYRILSSNCATDTLTFIKELILDKKIENQYITTPGGLLYMLEENGLANPDIRNGKMSIQVKKEKTYFFESKRNTYQKIFQKLKGIVPANMTLDQLLSDKMIDMRAKLAIDLPTELQTKTNLSALYIIEKLSFNRLKDKIKNKISQNADDGKSLKDPVFQKMVDEYKKSILQYQVTSGYGIPSKVTVDELQHEFFEKMQRMKNDAKEGKKTDEEIYLQDNFSNSIKNLEKINENIRFLKTKIIN